MERAKKILLYYNAYSGNGMFASNLDRIIERCQNAGFQVVPVRTKRGVAINQALGTIREEEYDRIIVAGGDGTVNLCVNAMIENDVHLPIGLLPSGTANDFAYYFELPNEMETLLDIALGNKTTKADVGVVNGRNFINVAAMGAMVDVSQKTDPQLKNAIGPMAYYLRAVAELPQVHPIKFRLTLPDEVLDEELYFMVVMNGESAGGFRKLATQSAMDDGKLDVIAFRKMPIIEFGPLLFEVMNGRHPDNKNVLYRQASELTIECEEDLYTDIDGEAGESFPLHFSVRQNRLDIFVDERTWHYDKLLEGK